MANPSKPSKVDLATLKAQLVVLQQLQGDIKEGRPGTWDSIKDGQDMANNLKGMQENVAQEIGQYYGDVSYHMSKAWTDLQGGVSTLAGLLQSTIQAHEKNEHKNTTGATKVNTGQTTED